MHINGILFKAFEAQQHHWSIIYGFTQNTINPDVLIIIFFYHRVIYRTRQMGRRLPNCKRTPPVPHRHRPRWRSVRRGAEAAPAEVRPLHQPRHPQQRTFLPSHLRGRLRQLKLVRRGFIYHHRVLRGGGLREPQPAGCGVSSIFLGLISTKHRFELFNL